MLKIQEEAGVTMIPTEQSALRVRLAAKHNCTVPIGIGVGSVKNECDQHHSTLIRETGSDRIRLENRLPGADADPFVVTAVTIAALVQAVREHVHEIKPGDRVDTFELLTKGSKYRVDVLPMTKHKITTPFPKNHQGFVERLRNSDNMRELFGDKFYTALTKEYGSQNVL
jgi:hypothetical protein